MRININFVFADSPNFVSRQSLKDKNKNMTAMMLSAFLASRRFTVHGLFCQFVCLFSINTLIADCNVSSLLPAISKRTAKQMIINVQCTRCTLFVCLSVRATMNDLNTFVTYVNVIL